MAQISDIAHRWANQDFGKTGTLRCGNCHATETSFYSYSTVIAQWLDRKRKIMAVIDDGLTKSTGKHLGWLHSALTPDTVVFRFHQPGYGSYPDVDVCNYRGEFEPMTLTRILVNNLYDWFRNIPRSSSLDLGQTDWWKELGRFGEYFPSGSFKSYLRQKMPVYKQAIPKEKVVRKMLRALDAGKTPGEVADIVNGKGTWEAYLERTKGPRTAARRRERAEKIARHLGFGRICWSPFTAKQLLEMTPLERVNLKLSRTIASKVPSKKTRTKRSTANIYKYLGIEAGRMYDYIFRQCESVTIPETGERIYVRSTDWHLPHLEFGSDKNILSFKANPKHYRKRFFQKARILGIIHNGARVHERYTGNGLELPDDDYLKMCHDRYLAFKEKERKREVARTRMLARHQEEARIKREAEEKARAAMVDAYRERGVEGLRDLWRDHLSNIPDRAGYGEDEFYYGGNVLLRLSSDKKLVETSKHIRLSISQATKLWKAVGIWHAHPEKFSRVSIPTQASVFTAHSYRNDILTAGCHSIAYCEMERMAKVLGIA